MTKYQKIAIAIVAVILLVLIVIASHGYIMLGGEGNYFLNYNGVKDLHRHSWVDFNGGTGFKGLLHNFSMIIFDIYGFLQNIGIPYKLINILSVFLVYFLPFIAMFWLLFKVLKIDFKVAFLVSLFYIVNPFAVTHFDSQMFWNIAPMFVLPFTLGIIYKYFSDYKKLFIFFGLFNFLVSFSFANIPYVGVYQIFLVFSIILIPFLKQEKFNFKKCLISFAVIEISFIVFNFWWLFPLIHLTFFDLATVYTEDFAVNWAMYSRGDGQIMNKLLSLRALTSFTSIDESFFSHFYNNDFVRVVLFIPLIYIFSGLFFKKDKNWPVRVVIVAMILLALFLNKGTNDPFGWLYVFMMKHIPLFIIFKTPLEKFSVLLVFLTSIGLAYRYVIRKDIFRRNLFYFLLGSYIIVCAIPYFTLNIFADYKIEADKQVSKRFIDKPEYQQAREIFNQDQLDYRVLSLPGSLNYQVTQLSYNNKYYRGMDPMVYSVNKPFIKAYDGKKFNVIFKNLSNPDLQKILSIFNIRKVLVNEDIYPSFGFKEPETLPVLNQSLSDKMKNFERGSIKIYENDIFLPKIYSPEKIIVSDQGIEQLDQIVADSNYSLASLVVFENDLPNKDRVFEKIPEEDLEQPVLEVKKVNPVKYIVIVHQAKSKFPLVFNETFDKNWQVYLNEYSCQFDNISEKEKTEKFLEYEQLKNYPADQASHVEVGEFMKKNWLCTFGDGKNKVLKKYKFLDDGSKILELKQSYLIDYISKNYSNTIQNNNIDSGSFYETWQNDPVVSFIDHWQANGYGNAWVIDPKIICQNNPNKCKENQDGSYDFEITIEYSLERFYFIGKLISGLVILLSTLYLIFILIKCKLKESK